MGIPASHLHQPNRDAFAKCCGQGFPNIYPVMLGDLPEHVQHLTFGSLFADFCGCCGGQLDQLRKGFKGLNKTQYFVLSVTLCQCRHRKFRAGPYRDQPTLVPKLIEDMVLDYGYAIHERPAFLKYKVGHKALMYNWSFLLRCDYPQFSHAQLSSDLGGEEDNASLTPMSNDDSSDACFSEGGILLPPTNFANVSFDEPTLDQSTSCEDSSSGSAFIPRRNLPIVLA